MKCIIVVSALSVSACTASSGTPQSLIAPRSSDQVDNSCILSASDHLRSVRSLSNTNGRTVPAPTGRDDERTVVLETNNGTPRETYIYVCRYNPRTSTAVTKPV